MTTWPPSQTLLLLLHLLVLGLRISLPFRSQVVSSSPSWLKCAAFSRGVRGPAAWPNAPPESRGLNWGRRTETGMKGDDEAGSVKGGRCGECLHLWPPGSEEMPQVLQDGEGTKLTGKTPSPRCSCIKHWPGHSLS